MDSYVIDECLSGNQIVELQNGNYALVARSGKRIFNQDIREQIKKTGTKVLMPRRMFQEEIEVDPRDASRGSHCNRANSF
jgi:hypothetical protein